MCGIFGIFGKVVSTDRLRQMGLPIAHRGPDETVVISEPGCSLGIHRLSIVDIYGGSQPLSNEDGSVLLVGNGEIYNHLELRQALIKRGHIFRTGSDMEVVTHLYEEHQEKAFDLLRGEFAIALWDKTREEGYLARDTAGVKPLYFGCDFHGNLLFSSEIKTLFSMGLTPTADISEIYRSLAYRSSSLHNTCFAGINKVAPGSLVKFLNATKSISKKEIKLQLPDMDLSVEESLAEAIKLRLMGESNFGVFLSGGLDSSLVAAFVRNMHQGPLTTFSVGYDVPGDEFSKAQVVAKYLSSRHNEVHINFDDLEKYFHKIIWHMDEPIFDPSMLPTYFLAQEAAKAVKFVLVGDGADEVFAGYDKHQKLVNAPIGCRQASKDYLEARMPFSFSALQKLKVPVHQNIDDFVTLLAQSPDKDSCLKQAQIIDRCEMLPSLQLMRVDKSTMAHGLEARVPFLDPVVVQASSKLSSDKLVRNTRGKIPLRDIGQKLLPKEIWDGQKSIFFVPLDIWAHKSLDSIANQIIPRSEFLRSILDVSIAITPYQKWCLLVLNSWHETFFEGKDPLRSLAELN